MKLRTEVGDQTQYLTREFNDSTIRFVVKYSGVIDAKRLEKAIQILIEHIDILHSTFVATTWGTKWITNQSYSLKDAMTINEISGDVFAAAKKAALEPIVYSNSVQIRCDLFCNQSESAIAFLVGHMCADGRDAVYLLEKLVKIYDQLSSQKTKEKVELKNGSRLIDQCYGATPEMLSFKIGKVVRDKAKEIKSTYQYGSKESGKPCLVDYTISKEPISNIKRKMSYATVNDIILAAYMRAYTKQMNISENTPVGIASMMDLRKYIPEGDSAGVTNLSGTININLPEGVGSSFLKTLEAVVQETTKLKEDPKAGLEFILCIRKIYGIIPLPLILMIGKKIYSNMSIGMTNIGNVKKDKFILDNVAAEEFIFAGPVKKKPMLQLGISGWDGELRLTIVSECTETDQKQLKELLRLIELEIINYAA